MWHLIRHCEPAVSGALPYTTLEQKPRHCDCRVALLLAMTASAAVHVVRKSWIASLRSQ